MDLFEKTSPWRPLVLVWMAYLIIGYTLFFMSVSMPYPSWRGTFIDYFSPMIKALNTAEKVALINGNDPFPAQLMIIYSAYGSILISVVGFILTVFLKDILNYYLMHIIKKNIAPLKFFFAGLVGILIAIFLYPRMLFVLDPQMITRRNFHFYSSNFISATFLLIYGIWCSAFTALGICAIYSSFLMKKLTGEQ